MVFAGEYTQQYNKHACFHQEFGSNICRLFGGRCPVWRNGESCGNYTKEAVAITQLPKVLRPFVDEAIAESKMVFVERDDPSVTEEDAQVIAEYVTVKHPFLSSYICVDEDEGGDARVTIYEEVGRVVYVLRQG